MARKKYRLIWIKTPSQVGLIMQLFHAGFQPYFETEEIKDEENWENIRNLPRLLQNRKVVAKGDGDILLFARKFVREQQAIHERREKP